MIYNRANIFLREVMTRICPNCRFQAVDDHSLFCNKCGYPFPQNQPGKPVTVQRTVSTVPPAAQRREPRPEKPSGKKIRQKKAGMGSFLSFDTLIAVNYLNLIYILGAVVIVLVSLVGITGGFAKPVPGQTNTSFANISFTNTTALAQDPAGSPLFWIGFLVAGSLIWRMFCELFVMLSRQDTVAGGGGETVPDDEADDYEEETETSDDAEEPTQFVECPHCRHIVPADQLRECENCGVQGCSNCIRMMGLLKKTMTCRECFEGN
jgi:hypothetical protein